MLKLQDPGFGTRRYSDDAYDNPGTTFKGYVIHEDAPVTEITLYMESLTAEEREIIKAGSLINFNKNRQM
ncbi:hypothetical protein KER13_02385 [Escherichia coli]|nr:hypothetical protein [Escherichia coli]